MQFLGLGATSKFCCYSYCYYYYFYYYDDDYYDDDYDNDYYYQDIAQTTSLSPHTLYFAVEGLGFRVLGLVFRVRVRIQH